MWSKYFKHTWKPYFLQGVDCEVKKDFCEEYGQPCRNGAACESDDTTFSYTCHCQPGYEGERYI